MHRRNLRAPGLSATTSLTTKRCLGQLGSACTIGAAKKQTVYLPTNRPGTPSCCPLQQKIPFSTAVPRLYPYRKLLLLLLARSLNDDGVHVAHELDALKLYEFDSDPKHKLGATGANAERAWLEVANEVSPRV